ncbi:MAG: Lrp/AsnC family transcriptional regulator [Gammaproteobacteria bacterium]|nr:Lrp/AsnC family transcriptional regulator [Gammaproteobacteria bacterium]
MSTATGSQEAVSESIIDDVDRQLIVATQKGLPLDPRPYNIIADEIGITALEVRQRLERMQDAGVIRRIGAVPNHYRLGYRANGMTVWNVPDEKIHELGQKVGALEFVSHCYQRPRHLPEWPYNLFAMVHAREHDEAMELVGKIAELLGDDNLGSEVLFSTRILKKSGLRLINKDQ